MKDRTTERKNMRTLADKMSEKKEPAVQKPAEGGDTRFDKIVKGMLIGIFSLIVLGSAALAVEVLYGTVYQEWLKPHFTREYTDWSVSPGVLYREADDGSAGYLQDRVEGHKLLCGVSYMQTGNNPDSLSVVCIRGKWGFVNRLTGRMAIPAVYDAAWAFSEGLAAVQKGTGLYFIDSSGRVVIDRGLQVAREDPSSYRFYGGVCRIWHPVTGRQGLLGRDGRWVLEPVYDTLESDLEGWKFLLGDRWGLYMPGRGVVLEPLYDAVSVWPDYIKVCRDGVTSVLDFDGNVLVSTVISSVLPLEYMTDTIVADSVDPGWSGRYGAGVADCRIYEAETLVGEPFVGLMGRDGRCVTPPLYREIRALSRDRYLALPQGVVLDSRGQWVGGV